MEIVWIAFSITAVILAVAGGTGIRFRRRSKTYGVIGRWLLAMAVGTAVFPALLPVLGVAVWASAYIAFVLVVTGYLTSYTVTHGRCRNGQDTLGAAGEG